jgi:PQQ-dependent catabolism-associated CXXCW motif protein
MAGTSPAMTICFFGRRILATAVIVLILASPAIAQVPEPPDFRLEDYRAPVPDTVAGGTVVHTQALQALLDGTKPVLIDVLPAPRRPEGMKPDQPWMPVPRRDLPGSVWLPDVGRGALAPAVEQWFQDNLARVTDGDKERAIVFYCLNRCWMSWNATKRAALYGYRHVYWYPDGSDGWEQAGLPLAEAKPSVPPDP